MSASLTALATSLVSDLGYWGLGVGLFIDSFGVPLPSEVLIPLAVVAAQRGHMSLATVLVLSVVAQVAGATVSYAIGRRVGLEPVVRWGRWVGINADHMQRAQEVFGRYGGWIAGVGRCIPLVRGLIGFPAGAAAMSPQAFVAWTSLGAVVWTAALAGAGELLSNNLAAIDRAFSQATTVVAVILVAGAAAVVVLARRAKGSSPYR